MNPEDLNMYIEGVREQNRRILSKTITLIESSRPDHQELARKIVDQLLPHTGKAVRLGITGVPGVGKSTFIESLGVSLAAGIATTSLPSLTSRVACSAAQRSKLPLSLNSEP